VSFSALRRSAIAATSVLAIGGTLAIAASASALPLDSAVTGGITSANAVLNGTATSPAALVAANGLTAFGYDVLDGLNAAEPGEVPGLTGFTAGTALTTVTPAQATQVQTAYDTLNTEAASYQNDVATAWDHAATTPSLAAYTTIPEIDAAIDTAAAGIKTAVAAATAALPNLKALATLAGDDPADYPNGLFSVDGDLSLSSSAAVTQPLSQSAFNTTLSVTDAAAGGYVIPSAFVIDFPSGVTVTPKDYKLEIQPTQESAPPANESIGTFVVDSPAASTYGLNAAGTANKVVGNLYLVANETPITGVATPLVTEPSLELYLGNSLYILGTFPASLTYPAPLTFGEVYDAGTALDPLPFSSVTLSFPAATSPVNTESCTTFGSPVLGNAVIGTAIDSADSVAYGAGDTSDGYTPAIPASGSTAAVAAVNAPVALTGSSTVVTDECAASARATIKLSKVKKVKKVKRAPKAQIPTGTLSLTIKGNGGAKFTAATIKLPAGLDGAAKKSVTVKFGAAASKTITIKKLKLTAKEAKAKTATLSFTVKYKENGLTPTSTAATATVKL
jgi:hypothetical protein